jgi:hypothetical protein
MICLSVKDLSDEKLISSFARLKLFLAESGVTETFQDPTIESIKWIGRVCQSLFLRAEIPEQGLIKIPEDDGILLPFDGPLKFISDLYFGKRSRNDGLSLEESRALCQIGSLVRALPYPSKEQSQIAIKETVKIITSGGDLISRRSLGRHRKALNTFLYKFPPVKSSKTHLSLSTSASYELTREQGGRSSYLVTAAKRIAEREVTIRDLDFLSGRIDCFGMKLINPITKILGSRILNEQTLGERKLLFGDILYHDSISFTKKLKELKEGKVIPTHLGRIIALAATEDLLRYGTYSEPFETNICLSFKSESKDRIKFKMTEKNIPVRASISQEAGMKTRMVTSAPASITTIGQLIGHQVRKNLSRDPFMRVGFDEGEKLWEVLKAYQRRVDRLRAKLAP